MREGETEIGRDHGGERGEREGVGEERGGEREGGGEERGGEKDGVTPAEFRFQMMIKREWNGNRDTRERKGELCPLKNREEIEVINK